MPRFDLDLTGSWQFKPYPAAARKASDLDIEPWYNTTVPSSIYHSLIDAGQLTRSDLDSGTRFLEWVSSSPWIFSKTFDAPAQLLECEKNELVFDGLDTIASIWLNDKLIAKTASMFRAHRFDITGILKPAGNRLMVKFDPARPCAQKLLEKYSASQPLSVPNPWQAYIRKAQFQFGSELGPALDGCGIFRPCRIEGTSDAKFENVGIRTIDANEQFADIRVAVKLARLSKIPLTCMVRITAGTLDIVQEITFAPNQDLQSAIIRIDRPFLWWPRGSGLQYLYNFELTLLDRARRLDSYKLPFGIRTVKLLTATDAFGPDMLFEINGRPVSIKGSTWTPLSLTPGRLTPADYGRALDLAAGANINMLRVPANTLYEDDAFYCACDRLGLLVWQDFMFASAPYPDRDWFLKEVAAETLDVVTRIRNHSCLALWCGSSELESLFASGRFGKNKKFLCREIFHNLLPAFVSEFDTGRDYIPTCPSPAAPPASPASLREVWNSHAPVRDYLMPLDNMPRFATAPGLASLPSAELLKTVAPKSRPGSAAIENLSYQLDGPSRLYRYTSDLFAPAHSVEDLAYKSQLAQARAAKLLVEHLRTHNAKNRGLLLGTFADCCPAITHSAIDSSLTPKALYFYMRRFFAPVLLAFVPQYTDSLSAQPTLESLSIVAVNDTSSPITAEINTAIHSLSGELLDSISFPALIAPFSISSPCKLPQSFSHPADPCSVVLFSTLTANGSLIARNRFLLAPDKHLSLPSPKISTAIEQVSDEFYKLSISSDVPALDVFLKSQPGIMPRDNFFDLAPSQPFEITLKCDPGIDPHRAPIESLCVSR